MDIEGDTDLIGGLTEGTEGDIDMSGFGSFFDKFKKTVGYHVGDDDWYIGEGSEGERVEQTAITGVPEYVDDAVNDIDEMYKENVPESDRIIIDALLDATPIIGEIRNVSEQIQKTRDYLENTGISYDDIPYQSSLNRALSGSLEHLYQGTVGRASRGSKNVHNVYSQ